MEQLTRKKQKAKQLQNSLIKKQGHFALFFYCVKKTPCYAGEFKKGYAYEWTKKLPLIKIELLSDNNKIKSKGGH